MSLKSYLCALAIFCGGYVFNTLLDSAVEAAQAYFQLPHINLQNGFQWLHHLQQREGK